MDQRISAFLEAHRVSVLGVLQSDGTIHSASLHYAHSEDPLSFYFITGKDSRKCQSLLDGSVQNASLVIGFNEEEFVTFQMEGKVKALEKKTELDKAWKTYLEKYPSRSGRKDNPEIAVLKFTPGWSRYTDMKTNPPTTISES